MTRSIPAQTDRSVVAGLFESPQQAQQAAQALAGLGVPADRVGLLMPGDQPGSDASEASGLLVAASGAGDLAGALSTMGVPEGETRFYTDEVEAGRSLLVANAAERAAEVRAAVLRHGGYDVQSRGAELARPVDAGVPGGTGPLPIDLTSHWEDVASRYEMLWEQHYGTSEATWEQMAPVYRWAWQAANQPDRRGRPWSEVEADVRRSWELSHAEPWDTVAGGIFDVWEDVAEDATSNAEGGQDRRQARPLE